MECQQGEYKPSLKQINGVQQKKVWHPKSKSESREGSPTDEAIQVASLPTSILQETEENLAKQIVDNPSRTERGTSMPGTSSRSYEFFKNYKPFTPSSKRTDPSDLRKRAHIPQEIRLPTSTTHQLLQQPETYERNQQFTYAPQPSEQSARERNVFGNVRNDPGQPPFGQLAQSSGSADDFSILRNRPPAHAGAFRGSPELYNPFQTETNPPILSGGNFQEYYARRRKELEKTRKQFEEIYTGDDPSNMRQQQAEGDTSNVVESHESFQTKSNLPVLSRSYFQEHRARKKKELETIREKFETIRSSRLSSQQRQRAAGDVSEVSLDSTYNLFQRNLPTISRASSFWETVPQRSPDHKSIFTKNDPESFTTSTQQITTSTTDTMVEQIQQPAGGSIYFDSKVDTTPFESVRMNNPFIDTYKQSQPVSTDSCKESLYSLFPTQETVSAGIRQSKLGSKKCWQLSERETGIHFPWDETRDSTAEEQFQMSPNETFMSPKASPKGTRSDMNTVESSATYVGKNSGYFPTTTSGTVISTVNEGGTRFARTSHERQQSRGKQLDMYLAGRKLYQPPVTKQYTRTSSVSRLGKFVPEDGNKFEDKFHREDYSFEYGDPGRPITHPSFRQSQPTKFTNEKHPSERSILSTIGVEIPHSASTLQSRRRPNKDELNISIVRSETGQPTTKELAPTRDFRELIPLDRKTLEAESHRAVSSDHGFSLFESTPRHIFNPYQQLQPTIPTNEFKGPAYTLFPTQRKTLASTSEPAFSSQERTQFEAREEAEQTLFDSVSNFGEFVPQSAKASSKPIPSSTEFSLFASNLPYWNLYQQFSPIMSSHENKGLEYSLFRPRESVSSTVSEAIHKPASTSQRSLQSALAREKEAEEITRMASDKSSFLGHSRLASEQESVLSGINPSARQPMITAQQRIRFDQLHPAETSTTRRGRPAQPPAGFEQKVRGSMPSSGEYMITKPKPVTSSPTNVIFYPHKQMKPLQTNGKRKAPPGFETTPSRVVDEANLPSLIPQKTTRGVNTSADPGQTTVEQVAGSLSPTAGSTPFTFKDRHCQAPLAEMSKEPTFDIAADEEAWPALTSPKNSGSKSISFSRLGNLQPRYSSTGPSSPAYSASSSSPDGSAWSSSFFSEGWPHSVAEQPLPVLTFSEIVRRNREKKVRPQSIQEGRSVRRGKEKENVKIFKDENRINPDLFPRKNCVLILPRKYSADVDVIEEILRLNVNFVSDSVALTFPTGAVLILCKSPEQADFLKRVVATSQSLEIAKRMRRFPREVRIDNISRERAPKSEILRTIESTYKETPRNFRLQQYENSNKVYAEMEVSSSLLKNMKSSPTIEIAGRKYKVDTSIRVDRCNRCHLLGHRFSTCGEAPHAPPGKDEPCLDCSHYNKLHAKKRDTNHPTGDEMCLTKQYYERKWDRAQVPYDEIDEEDLFGTSSDDDD